MRTVEDVKKTFDYLFGELGKVIVGQDEVLHQLVVGLFCNGHVLIEGYPGLAKTLTIKTLAELMDLKFSRIQNTPDLLPSDVTGTYLVEETTTGKRTFKFQQGPIFANIVLADEINRATPKTQSAMLEAMQEHQVTAGNQTFELEEPFFVLATQNPIEQEGTYPLPEAQSDRFLLKIKMGYPSAEDELKIVDRFTEFGKRTKLRPILNRETLLYIQGLTRQVPISNDIKKYVVQLVQKTRNQKDLIEYGAYPILRHRIVLSFEAERQNMTEDDVIKKLL